MGSKPGPSSRDILELLAARHSKDLFVPECKDGPTHTASHRRLDAWAMARSWAHPCFDGYEIKVSRSDWLKDQKMMDYMPLCNRLWVVAPVGVLQLEELPDSIGWLAPASTGSMLVTKRKAKHRQIEPPIDLLLYVLMCRSRIDPENRISETREDRAARWKRAVEDREHFERLGYMVNDRLRKETVELVQQAEAKAKSAEARATKLEEADAILKALGIDLARVWSLKYEIERAMDPLNSARIALESAAEAIAKVQGEQSHSATHSSNGS